MSGRLRWDRAGGLREDGGMAEHVIVVGGGIVGSSAAYELARRGIRVTLIDRADPGHATAAGAGIVSPATSFGSSPEWYPLAFRSVDFYPDLMASLAGDGTTDPGYTVPGGLVVAPEPRLARAHRLLRERRAAGVAKSVTSACWTGPGPGSCSRRWPRAPVPSTSRPWAA